MNWFKNKNVEFMELEATVKILQNRIYKLENPFKFNIGDNAVFHDGTCEGSNVKILDRYWIDTKRASYKQYDILKGDKLVKGIFEENFL